MNSDRRSKDVPDRGSSSAVGVALLVLVAVALAGTVGAAAFAVGPPPSPAPTLAVGFTVTDGTLALTHRGGDALDARSLALVVRVDGERLRYQPPVPFFSARGYHAGPTGPFNSASDPAWTVGETASLSVAGTNSPQVTAGATVSVTVYADDQRVLVVRAVAS